MRLSLLEDLVEYEERLGTLSVLIASIYQWLDVHVTKAFRWSSETEAGHMREIATLKEW